MFKLIVMALALAALLISPALPQSSQSKTGSTAAKSHAVKKSTAKSHAAKKGKKSASKAKASGKKVAKGKAARGKAAKAKRGKKGAPKVVKLTPEGRKALLDDAASLNEDLIGFALEGKANKVAGQVAAMRRLLPSLRPVLSSEAFEDLTGHTARMEQDSAANDLLTAALDSAEAYRTIEQAMDPAQRSSPVDVRMLDYAGYKLTILAVSPEPDWAKLAAAVKDANAAWSRLEEKVTDASLQNLLETIEIEVRDAVLRKDIKGVKAALKKHVDAIDALDRFFSSAGKAQGRDAR